LYALALYPRVEEKLLEEICVDGDAPLTADDVDKLPYLDAFVKVQDRYEISTFDLEILGNPATLFPSDHSISQNYSERGRNWRIHHTEGGILFVYSPSR
jgi:hypothetical protein